MKISRKGYLIILLFIIFQLFPVKILAECQSGEMEGSGSSTGGFGKPKCDNGVCYWSDSTALGVRFQIYKYYGGNLSLVSNGVDVWEMEFSNWDHNLFSSPNNTGLINKLSGIGNCDKNNDKITDVYHYTTDQYFTEQRKYGHRVIKDKSMRGYLHSENPTLNLFVDDWIKKYVIKDGKSYNEEYLKDYFGIQDKEIIDDMKQNSKNYYVTAEVLYRLVVKEKGDNVGKIKDLNGGESVKNKYFFGTVAEGAKYVAFEEPMNLLYISTNDEDVGEIVPSRITKVNSIKSNLFVISEKGNSAYPDATCNNAYGINIFRLSEICTECDDSSIDEEKCDPDVEECDPPEPETPDILEPTLEDNKTGCGENNQTCILGEKQGDNDKKCNWMISKPKDIKLTSTYCIDDSKEENGTGSRYKQKLNENNVFYKVECDETATIKNIPPPVTYPVNQAGSYNIYVGYTLDYKRVCEIKYKTRTGTAGSYTYGWTTDLNSDDIFLKKRIDELFNGTFIHPTSTSGGRIKVSEDEATAGKNSSCDIKYYTNCSWISCGLYGCSSGTNTYDSDSAYPSCKLGENFKSYSNKYYCTFNSESTPTEYTFVPICTGTNSCIANHIINYGQGDPMTYDYQNILDSYAALEELLKPIDGDYKYLSKTALDSSVYTNNNVIDAAKAAYDAALDMPDYILNDNNGQKVENSKAKISYYDYLDKKEVTKTLTMEPVSCTKSSEATYCELVNGEIIIKTESNSETYVCNNITELENGYEMIVHFGLPSFWRSSFPDSNGRFIFDSESACKTANKGNDCVEIENGYSVEPAGNKLIYHLNDIFGSIGKTIEFDKKISFEGYGMCNQFDFKWDCMYDTIKINVCDPESDNYDADLCSCQTYCGGDLTCLSKYCPDECPECCDPPPENKTCYDTKCAGKDEECYKSKCCKDWCGDKYKGDSTKYNTCLADECCAGQCNGNRFCSESCCHEICGTDINCINKYCPDPCFKEGCADYVYRTIDINNPFPNGRKPGKNWENKVKYITMSDKDNIDRDNTNGRSGEYEYRVELTSATIAKIRENKDLKDLYVTGKYEDGTDVPDVGEGKCYRSAFLHVNHDGDNGKNYGYADIIKLTDNEGWCNNK